MSSLNPAPPLGLRPKLRPSLSRKVKYWGIAPSAQKKLGREARRGSHDLRKLVGHANFLDELIEEFRIDDDSENPRHEVKAMQAKAAKDARLAKEAMREEVEQKLPNAAIEDDGEDTASDDAWSEVDSDDDEDHALVRTESGRLRRVQEDEEESSDDEEAIFGTLPALSKSANTTAESSPESVFDGSADYFNFNNLAKDSTVKTGEKGDVEIASPLSPGCA